MALSEDTMPKFLILFVLMITINANAETNFDTTYICPEKLNISATLDQRIFAPSPFNTNNNKKLSSKFKKKKWSDWSNTHIHWSSLRSRYGACYYSDINFKVKQNKNCPKSIHIQWISPITNMDLKSSELKLKSEFYGRRGSNCTYSKPSIKTTSHGNCEVDTNNPKKIYCGRGGHY